MLIRSQDKKLLVNLDTSSGLSIGVRGDGGNHVVTSHGVDGSYNFLGYYSTEEKAINVLDMIQDVYKHESMLFIMPADESVEV